MLLRKLEQAKERRAEEEKKRQEAETLKYVIQDDTIPYDIFNDSGFWPNFIGVQHDNI